PALDVAGLPISVTRDRRLTARHLFSRMGPSNGSGAHGGTIHLPHTGARFAWEEPDAFSDAARRQRARRPRFEPHRRNDRPGTDPARAPPRGGTARGGAAVAG